MVIIMLIKRRKKQLFTLFFIWTYLNPLHPRMLCAKFGWNWPSVSWKLFLISLIFFLPFFFFFFCYLVIISPWKRAGPFTWTNLNSNDPRLHCAKFGWNWPCASGEEDFLNFVNLFSLFGNYLLLEKGRALYFNKLESPSPKECFVPSLV